MKKYITPLTLASSCAILGAVAASPSAAQNVLEEVIVTAQFREQSSQDVPIAITAISSLAMEERGMRTALDINETVPNINVANNTGTSTAMKVYIRGVGEDESRLGTDPAVGVYIDDVYIGRQTGALFELANVASIEVLRGPQGTLYGRNSNGGAIRINSVQPTMDNQFVVKGSAGNYGIRDVTMMANGGLTDRLAGQVSIVDMQSDGYIKNKTNGKSLGAKDVQALRFALKYYGDNWDVLWSADYTDNNSDPGIQSYIENDPDRDVFTITDAQSLAASGITPAEYFNELQQGGTSLRISGAVGNMELTSITAYRELDNEFLAGVGGRYFQSLQQKQFSQELRLAGGADDYEWVIGVYLFREDGEQYSEFVAGAADISQITDAHAIYGQVTYDVTDRLSLTGGLRLTYEQKDFEAFATPDYWNSLGRAAQGKQDDSWTHVSWKGVVSYDLSDTAMTYFSITNGFKSGGWSSDSFGAVDEETVLTYEFGLKSDPLDSLRLNAAFFYNDYDGLQLNGVLPTGGFTRYNSGEVVTWGAELDLTWRPIDSLTIDAYVGYLDTEYKKLTAAAALLVTLDHKLKQAPEWSYGFNINHSFPVAAGEIISNLQFAHTAEQYNDVANTELIKRDDTDIVNLRVAYSTDTYSVGLWGRNLTDEVYYAAGTGLKYVFPGEPRTYGVDFRMEF